MTHGDACRRAVAIGLAVGLGLTGAQSTASATTAPSATAAAAGGHAAGHAAGHAGTGSATTVARTDSGLAVDSLAVPVADAAARSAGAAAELAPTRVRPFGLVGVTWQAGTATASTRVAVRLHTAGRWGGWQSLPWEASEGPAPGEDSDVRAGTGPLWVGEADGIAVRVRTDDGSRPADLQVVTVDPGDEAIAGAAGRSAERSVALPRPSSGQPITGAPKFPGLPRVISRHRWGADPSLTDPCDSPRYGRTAKMVFVHHTVNANNYSVRESPAIVRSIYAYHTQGQHWCDIGYNALVDRFGNIYEGRRGGLRLPVRGAHAGDYNTGTVGVSLMGNFEQKRPSARMKNALVRFIGWRLGTSYQPVRGEVRVNGAMFKRISGHRDAMSTACPGRYAYAQLPKIRHRVADYLHRYHSRLKAKAHRLGRHSTGPVWEGERALDGGFRTVFHRGVMYGKKGLGAHLLKRGLLVRFRKTGGPAGWLGWPTTDVRDTQVRNVRAMVFRKGRIYLIPDTAPKAVYGGIFRRYDRLGLAKGRLGLPKTNPQRHGHVLRVVFRHGTIWWNTETGKTRVKLR